MSTANSPDEFAFGLDQAVWSTYLQYRPPYPASQWHTWLDYHQGPLDVVHEIGTGCGIGMANLLHVLASRSPPPTIKRAILSDPSASNIAAAKALLSASTTPTPTELSFHQQPAEASFLPPASVDMVFACECLHFVAIDAALARMHEALRPGGTAAAVFYDCASATTVPAASRAEAAYRAVFAELVVGARAGRYRSRIKLRGLLPGGRLRVGLDWVPLDAARWADVTRVYVNVPEGCATWPLAPGLQGVLEAQAVGGGGEGDPARRVWVQDREGWAVRRATAAWIRGVLGTMEVELDDGFWEGPLWRELVAAVDEQGGAIWLLVRATYFMARKK